MKKLLTLLCLSFSLISCSKIDIDDTYSDYIKGTWQLVELHGSIGGPIIRTPVTDGYTYTFSGDNILITDKYGCNGTYQFKGGRLTLAFQCADRSFEESYVIEFEDDFVILHPSPINCDEGCSEKFKRITIN